MASNAIKPLSPADLLARQHRFEQALQKTPHLQTLLDEHAPFYERFKTQAIRAEQKDIK